MIKWTQTEAKPTEDHALLAVYRAPIRDTNNQATKFWKETEVLNLAHG